MKKTKYDISILVVEDDENILEQLEIFLRRRTKKIYLAENGKEGLDLFKKHDDIDLIITDVDMPKMNGIEMIKEIRNLDNKIPIVLVTGLRSLDVLVEAINLKISQFLQKPMSLSDLNAKIEEISKIKQLKKRITLK